MKTAWNSIAESVVNNGDRRLLSYAESLESPCATCQTAPCCTHLPLNNFKVTTLIELDHACYLLNFDHIELGISAAGDWSSYYAYPCRYLDRATAGCTVHGTPTQPHICVNYNPYNCWYKRVFTTNASDEFVRIDYARMQFLLDYIVIDEQRQIVSVPAWNDLVGLMAQFDDQVSQPKPLPISADAATVEWQQMVLGEIRPNAAPPLPYSYDQLANPCTNCAAHCCKTLVFPQGVPQHLSNLDYFRFCLGFPGVELGVADGQWSLIVKTTCRHLADNRCTLFGAPTRPLICRYYDEWKCTYKPQFGQPRPDGMVRVRLEQYDWLVEGFQFDEYGNVTGYLPANEMRQLIEMRWQAAGAIDSIALPMAH